MTEVCFRGPPEGNLHESLLSYETASAALSPYELHSPFENSIAVHTVSLGAAISLLNDLSWYLARTTEEVLLREPSVSETEYLSWDLAAAIRNGDREPAETGAYLKIYGKEDGQFHEPMYVTRRDGTVPEYDLAKVPETVVVRLTEREFETG